MAVAGIIALLIIPYFTGVLVTRIFRERKAEYVNIYVSGLLSLFVFFLACILVSLKLDTDLKGLEKLFFIPAASVSLIGVLLTVFGRNEHKTPFMIMPKKDVFFMIPAIFLGLYSFWYLAPSYVNNDSFEIVANALHTGSIYEYSSMTGMPMLKGLPIFNKILIMPLFSACMCDFFKIPADFFLAYVLPVYTYVVSLWVVYSIALISGTKNINLFMTSYLCILYAGTYLPGNGIPVTSGYALLTTGYDGYSVAYAVVLPFTAYLLIKRRYLHAVSMLVSLLGLLRLDRIYFALKNPVSSYLQMNSTGKFLILYIVAIIVYAFTRSSDWSLIISPSVFVASGVEKLDGLVGSKRLIYRIGVCAVIFSICGFVPFKGAITAKENADMKTSVNSTLALIDDEEYTIWAPDDFMAYSRRIRPDICTIYGRDDLSGYLQGVCYEDNTGFELDFYNGLLNMEVWYPFYPIGHSMEEILNKATAQGCDYLILPVYSCNTELEQWLGGAEYKYYAENEQFMIYKLP